MFVYFGKTHYSTTYGTQLQSVTCDKCATEYHYELARYGSGHSHSHYGIGEKEATRVAHGHSSVDLGARLADDGEMVPCPQCNWVNQSLVETYRRCHAQAVVFETIKIVVVSLLLIFAVVLPVYTWDPVHTDLAGVILAGSFVIGVVAVAGSIMARRWRQARINPNMSHPLRPDLPIGTPPALIVNKSNGKLEPASVESAHTDRSGEWQLFQLGRHEFPRKCCRCIAVTHGEKKHRLSFSGFVVDLPICTACYRNRIAMRVLAAIAVVGLLMGITAMALQRFALSEYDQQLTLVLCFAASALLAAVSVEPIVALGRGRVADRYRGVLWLRFRNPEYAVVTHFDKD
jgi:hypothetical protein